MKRYVKSPVGAHYGIGDWLLQRLTAGVMALYTVLFVGCLLMQPPATYSDWKAMFSGTLFRVATMFFFVALLYHAWIGMRDIVMDYVKPTGIRLGLESVVGAVLLLYAIWAASILWAR